MGGHRLSRRADAHAVAVRRGGRRAGCIRQPHALGKEIRGRQASQSLAHNRDHQPLSKPRAGPWAKRVPLDDELAERKLRYGAGSDAAYVHAREHPLWSAVDELPDDMRSAFHLYYMEGYATADIAKLMSCKPATVRSWLHRARKILRLNLKKEERHEQPKHARIRQSHEASPAGR